MREAFFLCRTDVVLDMLDLLASQEMGTVQAELLARGRTVLAARLNAFGELAFPVNCTPRIAWEALRAAMSEEDYYFSVADCHSYLPCLEHAWRFANPTWMQESIPYHLLDIFLRLAVGC